MVYPDVAAQAATVLFDDPGGEARPDRMAKEKPMKNLGANRRSRGKARSPEWAAGLRRLYDSVVDEPLPDSFSKLLDQLDENSDG